MSARAGNPRIVASALLFALAIVTTIGVAPSAAASMPVTKPDTVTTKHTARIDGREIHYTAVAGTIVLRNGKNEPTASVFYVAYVAQGLGATATRPITFAYNGGPGSSSALIQMGGLGPRTVVTANAAQTAPPPYDIVDNDDSLLATSDFVFIDAVGTGYSRIIGKGTPKDFYGVDPDKDAFKQFVRRYIAQNDRWNSPKFLAGESYGTMRSVVLAKKLQDEGIAISVIVLMSTVLDLRTKEGSNDDDEPYWLYVPSEAAVAAYYGKLPEKPANLDAFLQQARTFAEGPFANALAQGSNLSAADRTRIARELHSFTGLPVSYLEQSNLRVLPERFEKQLLSDQERTIGRFDGRFSKFDLDPVASEGDSDPTSNAILPAFTTSFNRYLRDELAYRPDSEYQFLATIRRAT
jgi:carboxypeptidase C (cathepsin A)